jgi:ribonuclease BN (tRNA processing enzyme)
MKVKILGTRGEIEASAPYHSHHSGVLLDNKILFDLGEPEFLQHKPQIIFFTHLHPDHAYFIRSKHEEPQTKAELYAPEKYKNNLDIKIIKKTKKINSYKITAIPTHHSKKVKSQAYLIEKNKQKILYTGDLIWINKKYHSQLQNLKLVITEASFFKKGGMIRRDKETKEIYGHNGVPDLINLFKRFTNNIILMHYGSWFYKDIKKSRKKIKKLARDNDINIIVGYDGLKIDVDNF